RELMHAPQLFLLPACGEKVPQADEGCFSPRTSKQRQPRPGADEGNRSSCHLEDRNARGPSSGAARHLLPACGEKGKACAPLAGRRKEHAPRLRGEGKSMHPACGEREEHAPRLRGKGRACGGKNEAE